jgi:pimeloyl-ACP methyl ester carboxylesterase
MSSYIDTIKLHAGDDPPVLVALHCSGYDGTQWRALPAYLSPEVALHACDLSGYGRFEGRIDTHIDLAAEAEHVLAQLPPYVDRFHLAGHSYGAAVALEIAMRHPRRVLSMVLHEPVRLALLRHFPSHCRLTDSVFHAGQRIIEMARTMKTREAAAFFVDFWCGFGTWSRIPEAQRELLRSRMLKVALEYESVFDDPVGPAMLRTIHCPVTITSGSGSPECTRKVGEILCDLLPQSQPVRFDGVGHMAPITHPGLFAAHLPAGLLVRKTRPAEPAYA